MKTNVYDQGRVSDAPQPEEHRKPAAQPAKPQAKAGSAVWLVIALLVLSAIPLIFGALRLTELASGAEITPANARFFASPLPVVLHIVSASLYAILGAFQFAPAFRRRCPGWHRVAGRFLVACGLLVGLSGLWMTLFYPHPTGSVSCSMSCGSCLGRPWSCPSCSALLQSGAGTCRDTAPGWRAPMRSGWVLVRRC